MEYKKCKLCKAIIKIGGVEEIGGCPFCGSEEFTRVTEKEWRQYYIGVVMQPFEVTNINASKQITIQEGAQ